MSSSGPELHAVGPGLQLRLVLPDGARDAPPERLPAVDVSGIAGARLTLQRGVEAGELELRAVCVTAPSTQWAPGIEELVLDRASALARTALGVPIKRWDAAPFRPVGAHIEQPLEGECSWTSHVAPAMPTGGAPAAIRGRHVLGFAGGDHTAVMCTVICVEAGPPARCGALVNAAGIEGTFVSAPEPSLAIRVILLAAEHPYPMAAGLGLAASAAVALLLARRPRPRP